MYVLHAVTKIISNDSNTCIIFTCSTKKGFLLIRRWRGKSHFTLYGFQVGGICLSNAATVCVALTD